MTPRPRWVVPAFAAGTALLAWAAWVFLFGGVTGHIAGIRISASSVSRPSLFGGMLLAAAITRLLAPRYDRCLASHRNVPLVAALTLAALALAFGLTKSAYIAGGPDPYGYVSQAQLWRAGTLTAAAPLSSAAPWPNGAAAFTPLGYRPAPRPGYMVPTYPPGLPIVIAAGERLLGDGAGVMVVPLLGALAVWLTFVLGRHIAGPLAGLIAAAALFSSPPFLFHLVAPMSDVPVTAWWLLAAVLAVRRDMPSLVASGAAAAMGVLTRPNLAPLGLVVAVLAIRGGTAAECLRRFAAWAAPALVGPAATALIHLRLYGSPMASGYGDLGLLYSASHVWPNVQRYASWLWTNQTPFIAAGTFAVSMLRRPGRANEAWLAAWCLAFALVVVVSYLGYLPFDDSTYLRFLLPAYPMLLATAAATSVLCAAARPRLQPLVAAALAFVLWTGWSHAQPALTAARDMARFRAAGEWARRLPADAVVISNLHSGSVRYYGNRLTLRYEWVTADRYDDMIAFLAAQHRPTYAMFDREELPHFTSWFAGSDLSWMRADPVAVIADRVYVYSVPLTAIVARSAS